MGRIDVAPRRNGWVGPALVLAVLYVGFVGYLAASGRGLPERVASHFNLAGRADGWMGRQTYLTFMAVAGLAVPLIIIGTCSVVRFVSDDLINLPDRAYWLAPGRRAETVGYLLRQSIWLGCWLVGLFIGLHYLTVRANQSRPVRMSGAGGLAVGGVFVAGVVVWAIRLVWHFRRRAGP